MNVEVDPTVLALKQRDQVSETWAKVRAVLQARLDLYRRQNDNDMAPEKTAMLRGRIAELKYLLAAGESQDQQP